MSHHRICLSRHWSSISRTASRAAPLVTCVQPIRPYSPPEAMDGRFAPLAAHSPECTDSRRKWCVKQAMWALSTRRFRRQPVQLAERVAKSPDLPSIASCGGWGVWSAGGGEAIWRGVNADTNTGVDGQGPGQANQMLQHEAPPPQVSGQCFFFRRRRSLQRRPCHGPRSSPYCATAACSRPRSASRRMWILIPASAWRASGPRGRARRRGYDGVAFDDGLAVVILGVQGDMSGRRRTHHAPPSQSPEHLTLSRFARRSHAIAIPHQRSR